jgi:hypothetical protein
LRHLSPSGEQSYPIGTFDLIACFKVDKRS